MISAISSSMGQVVGRKRAVHVEIIIEAAVDCRADGKLRVREQVQHGLSHDMAGGVPESLFSIRIVEGQDFDGAILFNRRAQIAGFPVDPGGAGIFGKSGTDAPGNLIGGGSGFNSRTSSAGLL
jgi:hypothetical protein